MPQNIFPDRLLILFPIPEIGRASSASLQSLEVTESGGQVEIGPIPLDPALIGNYSQAFSLPLIAERDQLQTQLTAANNEKADFANQVEALNAEINRLNAALQSATESNAALSARCESLVASIPFDPRIVEASAFLRRLTAAETFALFNSQHAAAKEIAATLTQYIEEDRPIPLDHQRTTAFFDALVGLKIITVDRVKEIRRDSIREEAYVADSE